MGLDFLPQDGGSTGAWILPLVGFGLGAAEKGFELGVYVYHVCVALYYVSETFLST